MYNKNPKEYREERGNRVGKSKKITYNYQGEQQDPDGAEGEDEFPEVEDQYSDYYEEMEAEVAPTKKGAN